MFYNYQLIDEVNIDIKDNKLILESNFNITFPCRNLVCNSSTMFIRNFINKLIFYYKDFFYSYRYNFC